MTPKKTARNKIVRIKTILRKTILRKKGRLNIHRYHKLIMS
jgi:hypothetical protein